MSPGPCAGTAGTTKCPKAQRRGPDRRWPDGGLFGLGLTGAGLSGVAAIGAVLPYRLSRIFWAASSSPAREAAKFSPPCR